MTKARKDLEKRRVAEKKNPPREPRSLHDRMKARGWVKLEATMEGLNVRSQGVPLSSNSITINHNIQHHGSP